MYVPAPIRFVLLACASLLTIPSLCGTSIFLKFGDIEGEATEKYYENWIELQSYQWGGKNPIEIGTGPGGGYGGGRVHFDHIVVTKALDRSTPHLFLHLAMASVTRDGEIVFLRQDPQGNQQAYLKITLEDVYISKIDQYYDEDEGVIQEEVALAFLAIHLEYTPPSGSPETFSWRLDMNTAAQ